MLANRIYKYYERQREVEPPRFHLGASEIGEECERRLWMVFRWCVKTEFEGRMLRLLDTGKREETRLLAELEAIGVRIQLVADNPDLQHKVSAFGGHFGGSMDAIATNIDPLDPEKPYILEFKTVNASGFTKLGNKGVKEANKRHYIQMQIYMGISGIHQALYLSVCKDNDKIYEEVVEFDHKVFDEHMEKAKRIVSSPTPPSPPANYTVPEPNATLKPRYKDCMYPFPCPALSMCYEGAKPIKNCRSCVFAKPVKAGEWLCNKHGTTLDKQRQLAACDEYTAIEI
jgi:hypothetical protein